MFATLEHFFVSLSGAQRLLALIVITAVSSTVFAFLAAGWKAGVVIGLLILAILWITRAIWNPPGYGRTRIRLASLAIVSSVALAIAGKTSSGKLVLTALLSRLGLEHTPMQQPSSPDRFLSSIILIFTLSAVFLINWLTRDDSAMQQHPKALDEDFPEQNYRQQLKRYVEILNSRLVTLDDETKWDDYFFAPLEAEVEVTSGQQSRKKIVDLMHALKAEKTSRIILVLGDPGAGKSIALRKLAKDLSREVERTGRVPVYISLKEWAADHPWSEQTPPTAGDLRAFILRTLKGHNTFADRFLEDYFEKMLDRGRLFFLFDSFDEIPAVLDVSEASWLIQHLSYLFTEFFMSQDAGRGIVASRFYRRPKLAKAGTATFEIRPFSDMRIHIALMKSSKLRRETVEKLFTARSELIPIARNPFSAALIRIYAENHGGDLPTNQLQMYESYTRERIVASKEHLQKYGFTVDGLIAAATEIAWWMFQEPEIGLEAPVSRLTELLVGYPVQSVTYILRYSGLGRLSAGPESRFSFVHRRLNEYFVARKFLNDPATISLPAIPSDSRYRDALALYCEVGNEVHVKQIANFCWTEIMTAGGARDMLNENQLRAVHCLRFLRDAFRTRQRCIGFIDDLASYVSARVEPGGDLLAAKIALEATGLLPATAAEPILMKAFEMESPWISETALHACRHLKRIDVDLERRLERYLNQIEIRDFLRRYREIVFSLSLSDAFQKLRRYCVLRSIENRLFILGVGLMTITAPMLILTMATMSILPRLILWPTKAYLLIRNRFRGDMVLMRLIFALSLSGIGVRTLLRAAPFIVFAPHLELRIHHKFVVLAAALYFATAVALSPWLDVGRWLKRLQWRLPSKETVLAILGEASLFVGLSVGLGIVFWALYRLFTAFEKWVGTDIPLGLLFVTAIGVFLCWKALLFLFMIHGERRLLKEVTRSIAITRSSIEVDFGRFRTESYRLKYVEWIRDMQVQPQGQWSSARPNIGNDRASSMLAQLDERWLGLES